MTDYLAGVDLGTTGVRCCLFDLQGQKYSEVYHEYGSNYPMPGWVEQDFEQMIDQTFITCRETISKSEIEPERIKGIAFSAQRSCFCPVDRNGKLVRPMISWQDARAQKQIEEVRALISENEYINETGLPLGTTWLLGKILWMRENEPRLYEKIDRIVQCQDLILRAFGGDDWLTDLSCAAFYGVWNVRETQWNDRLLSLFQLQKETFGRPMTSGTQIALVNAEVSKKSGFAIGTPLCVGAGDQNCSVLGMGGVRSGLATITLGTAGLAILSTDRPVSDLGGMFCTNHIVPNMWEIEGLSNAAASSFRWFRDELGLYESLKAKEEGKSVYSLLERQATESTPGSKGILFLPYLASAATPRWNPAARGAFLGMTFAHRRCDLIRAILEGVALEVRDMMEVWKRQKYPVETTRIGGGATKSQTWNQIQADVYGTSVQIVREQETAALGAAILAGVGVGLFSSYAEGVDSMVQISETIEPDESRHQIYEDVYQLYVNAYESLANHGFFDKIAKFQSQK